MWLPGIATVKQPRSFLPRLRFGAGSGWDGIMGHLDSCSVLRSVVAALCPEGHFCLILMHHSLLLHVHQACTLAREHAVAQVELLSVT